MPSWLKQEPLPPPRHQKAGLPPQAPPPPSLRQKRERMRVVTHEAPPRETPVARAPDVVEEALVAATLPRRSLVKDRPGPAYVSREEFVQVANALLNPKISEEALLAYPEKFGMDTKQMQEAIRWARAHEAKEAADLAATQVSREQVRQIHQAFQELGFARAVVEAHERFGLTKPQVRRALRLMKWRGIQRPPNPRAPARESRAAQEALEWEYSPSAPVSPELRGTILDPDIDQALLQEVKEVLAKTRNAYPEYLQWRFGLSESQSARMMHALRQDGFLQQMPDGTWQLFPGDGQSYPIILPEETPLAALPHLPAEEAQALERRLGEPGSELSRQTVSPKMPPTIDPTRVPDTRVSRRKQRGQRRILEEPYEEPYVDLAPALPTPPERPARNARGELKEPRPPLKLTAEDALKRRPPPPSEVKKAQAFVYGTDVDVREHDFGPRYHELSDEDAELVIDEEAPEGGDERADEAAPESGERVRESLDRDQARKQLEALQHVLAFAPRGAEYADRRAELEEHVRLLQQVMERSELEDTRDIVHERVARLDEALAELDAEVEKAQAAYDHAMAEWQAAQQEAKEAREAYAMLPEAVPIPRSHEARAKQVADWRKALALLARHDPGHKEFTDLIAGLERVMAADGVVTHAETAAERAREAWETKTAERAQRAEERSAAEAEEMGLMEKLSALDAAIGTAFAAGGLAALAWEGVPTESEELREIREQEAAERAAEQEAKRKANEEAAANNAAKWNTARKVGRGAALGGAGLTMVLGGAVWALGKATQLFFYVLRHPVKSAQFLWNKAVKFVQEGGGGGKTKPPKGASPNPA